MGAMGAAGVTDAVGQGSQSRRLLSARFRLDVPELRAEWVAESAERHSL